MKLLLVEDDVLLAHQLKWLLREYEILIAANAQQAIKMFIKTKSSVIMLDLGLPPCKNTPDEGLKVLKQIIEYEKRTKVIVLTGQEDKTAAIKAISLGAFDYIMKPATEEVIKLSLERAKFFIDIEKELKEKNLNAPTGMDIERGFDTVKEETEKEVIKNALEQTNFNISQTARLLKLRRTSLYYFMNKYNLKR
ncbi:MAG: response regulator [Campylobacterota bacterium]|nr:response regulator [Campylobacterota bacterium]